MMTEEEKAQLFLLKYKKHIKSIEIANKIGCSQSLISGFFSGKCNMSDQKKEKLRSFITDYPEMAIFKVRVKPNNQ